MTEQPASPSAQAIRASMKALIMQATPEDVLQRGNAIRAEAVLLADKVQRARADAVVREPGRDPVSLDAAPRFNAMIAAQFDQIRTITDEFKQAADELARMARNYGHTEEAIEASFAEYQLAHPPPSTPGSVSGTPPRPS